MERNDTMSGLAYRDAETWHTEAADHAYLPPPPSLHWGWVFLLSILTLGIFAIVWPFIQANCALPQSLKGTPVTSPRLIARRPLAAGLTIAG